LIPSRGIPVPFLWTKPSLSEPWGRSCTNIKFAPKADGAREHRATRGGIHRVEPDSYGPAPGGGRRAHRLLRPEPVHPSLPAPGRRHPGAVPDARKNRLTGRKPLQEPGERAPYHSHEQGGAAWWRRGRTVSSPRGAGERQTISREANMSTATLRVVLLVLLKPSRQLPRRGCISKPGVAQRTPGHEREMNGFYPEGVPSTRALPLMQPLRGTDQFGRPLVTRGALRDPGLWDATPSG